MAGNRRLSVEITGDTRGLSSAIGEAEGHMGRLGSAIGTVARVGATAVAGLGLAAVTLGPQLYDAGVGMEALAQKSATVFGETLPQVEAWAEGVAGAMGLTTSEAVGAAAGLADLLKPMGFTAQQSADMSTEMLNLSGALSAWSGGTRSAAEVSDILSAAMLGERDSLQGLGIAISADEVATRAAAIARAEGRDEITAMDEALATQQLIIEKSTDAQAAWADGSMASVQAQNEQRAAMSRLREVIAGALFPALSALVPIMTNVVMWLGDRAPAAFAFAGAVIRERVIPVVMSLVGWVRDQMIPAMMRFAGFVVDDVVPALISFGQWMNEHRPVLYGVAAVVGTVLVGAFIAWATAAGSAAVATIAAAAPLLAIAAAVGVVVAAVYYAYQNWGWFRDAVHEVAQFLTDTLWPALQSIAQYILDHVIPAVAGFVGWVRDNLVPVIADLVTFIVTELIPTVARIVGSFIEVAVGVGVRVAEIVAFVIGIPGQIAATVSTMWNGITSGITNAKDWVDTRVSAMVDAVAAMPGRISNAAAGMFNGIKDAFRSAINWVIDAWNGLDFSIGGGSVFGVDLPGATFGTPNIPRLEFGGPARAWGSYLVGERGPEILHMGPSSGFVSPNRSLGGGSGVTQIVVQLDGRTIGEALVRASRNGGPVVVSTR